jgi:FkbM family methyltransferase
VKLIPDLPCTRRIPGIGRVRFRMRQHRWFLWQEFGRNDHFMLGVFHRLVRPGDVVFDIGANIGVYARMLVQWFGASCVEAFEPMSQNVELLCANAAIGPLPGRIEVHAIALADRDGHDDLQIDDVRSTTAVLDSVSGGDASAGRKHFDLPPLTERVAVARLDTLMASGNLPVPDVMKIDTEGAEALVIAGAAETLRAHRPRLTVATHGPDKVEATIVGLRELGYHCAGFVTEEGSACYRSLEPADAGRLANNNIICSADENDLAEPVVPMSPQRCRRDLAAGE